MTGPLLRTGTLTAFHPLGAVGNPVYLAAAQLRAALSRRLGTDLADSFAIPQRNEDGDTIDWYAPRPGAVVPWSAAGADERAEAQRKLVRNRERIEALGQTLAAETDSERQVFGRLLAQVTSFPDEDHIYLVDGLPVVTFWGFVTDQSSAGFDPLMNLSLLAAPPPQAPPRRRRWWLWLLLPLLLLLLLLSLLMLRVCQPTTMTLVPPFVPGQDGYPAPDQTGLTPDEQPPSVRGAEDSDEDAASPRERDPIELDRHRIERHTRLDATDGSHQVTRVTGDEGQDAVLHDPKAIDGEVHVDGAVPAADSGIIDTPDDDQIGAQSVDSAEEPASVDDAEATLVETPDGPPIDGASPETEDDAAAVDAETVSEDTATETPVEAPDEQTTETPVATPDEQATEAPVEATEDGAAAADDGSEAPSASEPPDEATSTGEQRQEKPAPDDRSAPDARGPEETSERADPTGPDPQSAASVPTGRAAKASRSPEQLLRSGWRTATTLQDANGMPIQMEYELKDGAGKIRVKRHDGSVCENGAAALVRDGKLVIDSEGDIVCGDGTSFGDPTIECAPDKKGQVGCEGRYQDGRTFSIETQQDER